MNYESIRTSQLCFGQVEIGLNKFKYVSNLLKQVWTKWNKFEQVRTCLQTRSEQVSTGSNIFSTLNKNLEHDKTNLSFLNLSKTSWSVFKTF